MGGTLKTKNFVISSPLLNKKSLNKPISLFYGEIGWTKLNKIVILPYFPYNPKAKLRLEVLFKKFHPRLNLATQLFSGHENRSLTKSQQPLQGWYP
jgi:hypothetical protein